MFRFEGDIIAKSSNISNAFQTVVEDIFRKYPQMKRVHSKSSEGRGSIFEINGITKYLNWIQSPKYINFSYQLSGKKG